MTGRALFKIPAGRRALKLAREQGLEVTGYDVRPDGSIHVEVRDQRDGEVLTAQPPNDLTPEVA